MFKDWHKRSNPSIENLDAWQAGKLIELLRKAYAAGKKEGRGEVLAIAKSLASTERGL
jgi:hypothetical protein